MQCNDITQVCVFLILRLYFIVIQSNLHTLKRFYYIYISLILFLLSIHEICMALYFFFFRSALFFLLLLHMGLYISLIHLIHD